MSGVWPGTGLFHEGVQLVAELPSQLRGSPPLGHILEEGDEGHILGEGMATSRLLVFAMQGMLALQGC